MSAPGRVAPNPLRGEFEATLAGETIAFDTTLGTVAMIEERCGLDLVGAVERAVVGRRATDRMALIAGALLAAGHAEAEMLAARTATIEAERFVLSLMEALGFELARRGEAAPEDRAGPFAAAPTPGGRPDGGAGAPSRSVP